MSFLRKFFAPVGYVLGPIGAGLYYVYLRLVNGRGQAKYIFTRPRGKTGTFLLEGVRGVKGAVTLGRRIFTEYDPISAKLLFHELDHRDLIDELGKVRFYARWGYQFIRFGYQHMPIEIRAWVAASKVLE